MAKAYQCDRCGKCYPEGVDYSKQTLKLHNIGLPADLCDDCYEQLVTWFDDSNSVFIPAIRYVVNLDETIEGGK